MAKIIRTKGKKVVGGRAEGEAIVSTMPISFTGSLDPSTGIIREPGHDLEGTKVSGKILVFPTGKGSTTGSWQFYVAFRRGNAPKGMICVKADGVVAVAAMVSGVPLVHELELNPIDAIETGDFVVINADEGIIEIHKRCHK